jgi:predicted dienelactone hydrolase
MKVIRLTIITLFIATNLGRAQNFNVGELTLNLTDSTRHRLVKTELWYPTMDIDSLNIRKTELPFVLEPTIRNAEFADLRFPLILLSHGTGGNRFSLAWLAIALAKHGYVVAAPDHWGNTFDNKIPEFFIRYWERPLDISFIISQILKDKKLSQYVDSNRIGAAGFSFGGYTSLALAGAEIDCKLLKSEANTIEGKKEFTIHELGSLRKSIEKLSCDSIPSSHLKDDRIKAFVALAPALGLGVGSTEQTRNISSPVLIIGAENDQIAPVLTNAKHYRNLIPGSEYMELPGKTGHYIFLDEGDKNLQREAKIYYKDDESIRRGLIHKNVNEIILSFFERNVKNLNHTN